MIGYPCSVDGCRNEAKKGGLCWGHRKKKSRGHVVNAPLGMPRGSNIVTTSESAWSVLTEAALAYADADAEDEAGWRRARDNLRKAAQAYASGTGQVLVPTAARRPEPVRRRRERMLEREVQLVFSFGG